MAAPSGTSWSSVFGSGNYQARLGIYISLSSTNTQTTVTAQIWYWARYAVSDSGNTFYMDWDSYADTSIGSKSISTSNSEWSTSNQIAIGTYSKTFNRGTSNQTGYFSSRFKNIEYGGGSGSYYVSYTIPALSKYTVSYNANGGTGTMSTDTVQYNAKYKTKANSFTRPGYKWVGWNEKSDGTGTDWTGYVGKEWTWTYTKSITLYAIWKPESMMHLTQGGTAKRGKALFKSGSWKNGIPWLRVNGTWKRGGA